MRFSLIFAAAMKRFVKTGRRQQYGQSAGVSAEQFQGAIRKHFTRHSDFLFGHDTGVEGMKLLISAKSQKVRFLDQKKVKQLEQLYSDKLSYVLGEFEELVPYNIQFNEVKIPQAMFEVIVSWKCKGNENDQKIGALLDSISGDVRTRLSSEFYGNNVPKIRFVPDYSDLKMQEMDHLFAIADYGMQYRALSKTGSILGSMGDTGKPKKETVEKVPRWKLERMEKIQKLKEVREKLENEYS